MIRPSPGTPAGKETTGCRSEGEKKATERRQRSVQVLFMREKSTWTKKDRGVKWGDMTLAKKKSGKRRTPWAS